MLEQLSPALLDRILTFIHPVIEACLHRHTLGSVCRELRFATARLPCYEPKHGEWLALQPSPRRAMCIHWMLHDCAWRPGKFPAGLRRLLIDVVDTPLPSGLQELVVCRGFRICAPLPSLQRLVCWSETFSPGFLPPSLVWLEAYGFQGELNSLPSRLTRLRLPHFNRAVLHGQLPPLLRRLELPALRVPLAPGVLPSSVDILTLGSAAHSVPDSVEDVRFFTRSTPTKLGLTEQVQMIYDDYCGQAGISNRSERHLSCDEFSFE